MALYNPPPPLLTTAIYNNGGTASSNIVSQQPEPHSSSSSTSTSSSIVTVIIVIASAIIVSASIYLLLRFFSRRCSTSFSSNDVVPGRRNENENGNEARNHHVICFDSGKFDSLPLFTFSSITGESDGGDCAVCLSKFEAVDQLRLLPVCCHAFHAECIDVWLKSNQTCPLCRSTVNPTDDDMLSKILSVSDRLAGGGGGTGNGVGNRNDSFRIEIGSVNRRRTPSDSGRRSYSIGSYEYVLDDGHEVLIESTHRRETSDKDLTTPAPPGENLAAEIGDGGGSGRLNWLRDYVDRVSVSISSRSQSFRGSGRFFAGSSRRSEAVDDFEAAHSRVGEEISELFRWLSGV